MTDLPQPSDFERDLQAALRRSDPPVGFVDRVMARTPDKRQPSQWGRRWLAAAAALFVAVIGTGAWEQHQRRVEGERARRDLIYALTVASESLQTTKHILTR